MGRKPAAQRDIRNRLLRVCQKLHRFRNPASIMNEVYFRSGPDAFVPRTLENKVEAAGAALDSCLDAMTAKVKTQWHELVIFGQP